MIIAPKAEAKQKAIQQILALIEKHRIFPHDLNFHQTAPTRWSFTRWDGAIIRGNVLTRLVWENRAYFKQTETIPLRPMTSSWESKASQQLRRVATGKLANWNGWKLSDDIFILEKR